MAKKIEPGHVVVTEEGGASEAELLIDEQNASMGISADTSETEQVPLAADDSETGPDALAVPPAAATGDTVLVLKGAASLLSHGILFKKWVPVPMEDEALRSALRATGLFV